MNNTYFVADTHFGHKNIIASCNRPFRGVDEMNKALITNWNNRVDDGDTVYHLGDVFGCGERDNRGLIYSLNGRKVLLPGNHDNDSVNEYILMGFDECLSANEFHEIFLEGKRILVSHHPPQREDIKEEAIYIFGHLHNRVSEVEYLFPVNAFCVSVERTGYKPILLPEIIRLRH